jgi:hypothetical protein
MNRPMKSLALLLALGATACGVELADGSYTGEARFKVTGEVQSLSPVEQKGKTRVALAWDNWARSGDITFFQSVEVNSKNPPFGYELRLLENPEPQALNNFQTGLVGTAYVSVYEDVNGNGKADDGDVMRGLAPGHIVLFVPEITPQLKETLREWGRIVNLDDLKPGYNLARGICAEGKPDSNRFDDLRIVADEPVPVASVEEANTNGCLNFH